MFTSAAVTRTQSSDNFDELISYPNSMLFGMSLDPKTQFEINTAAVAITRNTNKQTNIKQLSCAHEEVFVCETVVAILMSQRYKSQKYYTAL